MKITSLLIGLFFLVLFSGCEPKVVKTSTMNNKVKILFVLENSGSMAGFLVGNSAFKENITSLASSLDKISGNLKERPELLNVITRETPDTTYIDSIALSELPQQYFTAGSTAQSKQLASTSLEFNQKIKTGLAIDQTSPIDGIIQNCLNEDTDSNVTVLISDFVFDDRSQDCGSLLSGIKGRIQSIFNDKAGENKNFAVNVYRFVSSFSGPYETCDNGSMTLNSPNHPYFVWIFGNKRIVDYINVKLEEDQSFRPTHVYFFGKNSETITFEPLQFSHREGQWIFDSTAVMLKNVSAIGTQPVKITFGLDLNEFPNSLKDSSFLAKNLKFEASGLKLHTWKLKRPDEIKNGIDPKDQIRFKKYNWFVEMVISEPTVPTAELEIELINNQDRWFDSLTTANDALPGELSNGKTFGLKQFLNGVESAFSQGSSASYLFEIKIKVEK